MTNTNKFQICSKCIMDSTDPDIYFDKDGICNHCKRAEFLIKERTFTNIQEREQNLMVLINKIKAEGKGKKYDCIIGVSGGVDSTFVAYEVKRLGLRPLAIHLDNGWNSELAVGNIEKTLNYLKIDLFTHVIDWEEFKDIQLSFLKASTPDSEVPTDHAIISILYKMANKYNVKYILNGVNLATESILPLKWGYGYFDFKYIKSVQKIFGTKTFNSYPFVRLANLFYYAGIKKIKFVPFLNYVEYNKEKAMDIIQSKLGWVYYGGKHYESIYTRFLQSYILPKKFGIDKRKGHLSSLIVSNQITREEALFQLSKEICPANMLLEDYEYTVKKFGITKNEFEQIMESPVKSFEDYPNNFKLLEKIKNLRKIFNYKN